MKRYPAEIITDFKKSPTKTEYDGAEQYVKDEMDKMNRKIAKAIRKFTNRTGYLPEITMNFDVGPLGFRNSIDSVEGVDVSHMLKKGGPWKL